jgi:plastocyanin
MPIPRILFGLPLIAVGVWLPAAAADPAPAPANTVGMDHEVFTVKEMKLQQGQKLTLVNNSRWLHIIGPGEGGSLTAEAGNPMRDRVMTETNDHYTTAPWNQPGTFYVTCSIHPEMTVKVVVTACDSCCSPAGCG